MTRGLVEWQQRVTGEACGICAAAPGFAVTPEFVASLDSGAVVLQDDGAFRGYCILFLHQHAAELFDLSAAQRARLMEDVNRVALALRSVVKPAKLNYVILGNEQPHLHVHVIPRFHDDGWWGEPIWKRPPDAKLPLPPAEFARLRDSLRQGLLAPQVG